MNEILIVAQTTLVDIQPVSRYQPEGVNPDEVPDEADLLTQLVLAEPLTEGEDPQGLFGVRDASVSEDRLSVALRDRVRIPPEKGYYWLHLELPQPGTRLAAKGNDVSSLVLLPRAHLHGTGSGPAYDVCLEDVRVDPTPKLHQAGPVIFGVGGLPALAGRIAVALHTRKDPEDVWWYYNKIREQGPS